MLNNLIDIKELELLTNDAIHAGMLWVFILLYYLLRRVFDSVKYLCSNLAYFKNKDIEIRMKENEKSRNRT